MAHWTAPTGAGLFIDHWIEFVGLLEARMFVYGSSFFANGLKVSDGYVGRDHADFGRALARKL